MKVTLDGNDARVVCHALHEHAAELTKLVKRLKKYGQFAQATAVENAVNDVRERLGPLFDEQGTFPFSPLPPPRDDAEDALHRERKKAAAAEVA